ncbi:MAG TPA: DUF1273 domain-containing protein [Candidatus Tidjanibacter gallistercoris]|nr:DUF1273 domain-containing protein [Candidatus Tidjanibacter gallistercoris]
MIRTACDDDINALGLPRARCAAFTGYRPAKFRLSFPAGDAEAHVRRLLRPAVRELYDRGVRMFLSGMAEGFDLWAAEEVLSLRDAGLCPDAGVVAVIPFRGQERRYDVPFREAYRHVCERASVVEVLAAHYYPECFYRRNDYLVDNSSVLTGYYDGQRGGTAYTVRRALGIGIPFVNLCVRETLFPLR